MKDETQPIRPIDRTRRDLLETAASETGRGLGDILAAPPQVAPRSLIPAPTVFPPLLSAAPIHAPAKGGELALCGQEHGEVDRASGKVAVFARSAQKVTCPGCLSEINWVRSNFRGSRFYPVKG